MRQVIIEATIPFSKEQIQEAARLALLAILWSAVTLQVVHILS